MFEKINKYSFLILAVAFFAAAAIIENGLLKKHPETHLIEDFQKKLLDNEKEMHRRLNELASLAGDADFDGSFQGRTDFTSQLLEETGFGFLVYQNGGDETT